jgi:hypothetical protein
MDDMNNFYGENVAQLKPVRPLKNTTLQCENEWYADSDCVF